MTRTATELVQMIRDARDQSLRLVADLSDEQLMGPHLSIINPLIWEIGHVAWFQEKWVLRHLFHEPAGRSDADRLYDSAAIPHDTRWDLPLPSRAETVHYGLQVRDRVIERIERGYACDGWHVRPESLAYFVLLSVFHEDMHTEAFTYTRQTLQYPPPLVAQTGDSARADKAITAVRGDVAITGGEYWLGSSRDEPFVFDNEKWIHAVPLEPFFISRTAVTQSEFAAFVEGGGYVRRDLWSDAGWHWRQSVQAEHPVYWERQAGGDWLRRHYDVWLPVEPDLPMVHVNWYEADAYCRWVGRRLPTEAEWELAATGTTGRANLAESGATPHSHKPPFPWGNDKPGNHHANLDWTTVGCIDVSALPQGDSPFGCRQMIGNVWEWTASDFGPYPDFSPDAYEEYSEPWFGGTHKVLRGGAYATRSRLIRNNYRNFFAPNRRDVFAGFRTCSL